MTKREELIKYVEDYVNDEIAVQFITMMVETNETCFMFVSATKEQVIDILNKNFTEDLVGSMPNDITVHHIIGWLASLR